MAEPSHVNSGPKLKPLDKQTVRELWSRTYNTEGKPEWSPRTHVADGWIVHQRDYFDLWGDIFNGIPGWRRISRRLLHRLFG